MTLAVSGTLRKDAKVQYLCTIVRGEVLHFDSLSTDAESTNILTVDTSILGLALYFSPVHFILKQKRAMRRVMRKPHGLKVRHNADCLIVLNDNSDFSLG